MLVDVDVVEGSVASPVAPVVDDDGSGPLLVGPAVVVDDDDDDDDDDSGPPLVGAVVELTLAAVAPVPLVLLVSLVASVVEVS